MRLVSRIMHDAPVRWTAMIAGFGAVVVWVVGVFLLIKEGTFGAFAAIINVIVLFMGWVAMTWGAAFLADAWRSRRKATG